MARKGLREEGAVGWALREACGRRLPGRWGKREPVWLGGSRVARQLRGSVAVEAPRTIRVLVWGHGVSVDSLAGLYKEVAGKAGVALRSDVWNREIFRVIVLKGK